MSSETGSRPVPASPPFDQEPVVPYNFFSGNPDPVSFPAQGLADAAHRILPSLTEELVKYPDRYGYRPLREIAAERFKRNNGVELPLESIAIIAGSFQGVGLATQTFIRQPGDTMITVNMITPSTTVVISSFLRTPAFV